MQTSVTGNLSCCGNQSYSPRQELCCGHETRIVLNKTALDHDQCCPNGPTGQQYGPTGQQYSSCKKGEPVPTEGSSMCGKAPYNQTRDLCCNNEVHRDGTAIGKKCCGPSTWAYFPNNETCCFNEVKPKALGLENNFFKCKSILDMNHFLTQVFCSNINMTYENYMYPFK